MKTAYNPLEMPHELTPALKEYYGNKKLLWRNLVWYMLLTIGWNKVFQLVTPLMILHMNSPEVGMDAGMIGGIAAANGYAVAFLVMYFAWKSDHTISRWGRRIPFLWISAPFIIVTVVIFPFIHNMWILLGVVVVYNFFMDMKASTISLLPIDLVPRHMLARVGAIPAVVMGVLGFFVLRYGMLLSDINMSLPFLIGGAVMLCTTLCAFGIKEPPIQTPATEPFKPWSALKVGWKDRRMIILMLTVPMLTSMTSMYTAWIWLFAKNELNLSRTEMGDSLSWASVLGLVIAFPCAWLIDRISPFKLAGIYLAISGVLLAALMQVSSANGLILVSFIFILASAFSGIVPMMVFRSAHPAEVGSVTSSSAMVSQSFNATMLLVSGQLIERLGHNYKAAFILGFCISILGLCMLMLYRHLMKTGLQPVSQPLEETPVPEAAR